jgi:4-aminobutyrate aminotransferase-like enzyme
MLLRVTHGTNDLVHTADGRSFIDLISSTGAVFLGHANERINSAIAAQLGLISCSWTSEMDIQDRCKAAVGAHLPSGFDLYSLYSSGAEAADVALRIAQMATGRRGAIGFRHGHHGKSLAVQNLTGLDDGLAELPGFHRIGFVPHRTEAEVLDDLRTALATGDVAAVFIEPMQGRGGGHEAGGPFHAELGRLCAEAGALVVCDEIFTGWYRTGEAVRFPAVGLEPDIVLLGKALGNGFPLSGLVLAAGLQFHPKDFRLNSTFSDNPLACAAATATVAEMERIDVRSRVARIESRFAEIAVAPGAEVRHRGAAYFVELPSDQAAAALHDHLLAAHILALRRDRVVGLWPPATITDDHLDRVVQATSEGMFSRGGW